MEARIQDDVLVSSEGRDVFGGLVASLALQRNRQSLSNAKNEGRSGIGVKRSVNSAYTTSIII